MSDVEFGSTFGWAITAVEYWQPTMSLRYSKADVLEQAWQSTTGKVEWRPVPREE